MAVQEINSADKLLNIFRREIWTKKNTIFVPFLTSLVLLNKVEILNGISVLQESGPKGLATILEGEKYDYMYFFCNYLFLPLLSAFFIQIFFVLFKVLLSSVDFRLDKTIYKLGVENTLNLKLKGENEKLEISLTKAETEAERLRNREEAFDGLTFSNLKIWSGIRVDHITYKFTKSNGSNGGISQESVRWNFGKEIGILESPFDPDNPNTEQRKVAYDLIGCFNIQNTNNPDPRLTIIRHKRENGGIFLMLLRKQEGDNIFHGVEYEFGKLEENDQKMLF